jgi:hypothetical protein
MKSHPLTQRHNLLLLTAILIMLIMLLLYSLIWRNVYQHPALEGVDFLIFYTAGTIARDGTPHLLYDIPTQQTIQQTIVDPDFVPGSLLPYNHPPFLLPIMGWMAGENYHASYLRWTLLLLLLLGACGLLITHLLHTQSWRTPQAVVAALGSLFFYPIFISLLKGQDTIFVLAGVLLWIWALQRQREALAGVAIVLATLRPQLALPLMLPMFVSRPRSRWWLVGSGLLLLLLSFVLIGWQGWRDFLHMLLLTAQGAGMGIHQDRMYNLSGLLLRLAPDLPPAIIRGSGWGGFLLACSLLSWLWWRRRAATHPPLPLLGLTLVLSLFASPHLHFHDVSLLLPALVIASILFARQEQAKGQLVYAPALPAICAMLLLLASLAGDAWLALAVYGMMAGVGSYLIISYSSMDEHV